MEQLSQKIFLGNNIGNYVLDYNIKKYIIEYLKNYKSIFTEEKPVNNLLDLHYIKNNPYVFIPYFSMNSYFLLFIHHSTYYLSVLIDKQYLTDIDNINFNKLKIFHIRLRGNKNLYNGTLFSGNLIRIDDKSIFLINNIYVENSKLIKENYLTKIKIVDNILNQIQTDKIFDTFELKVIRYYKIVLKDLDEFKNKLPNTKLPINGMLFVSIDQNIVNYYSSFNKITNTNDNAIIKSTNNIDNILKVFQVKKINIPDVYELFCIKNNDYIKYGIAYISSLDKSRELLDTFTSTDLLLMECNYNKKFNKWEPLKITTKNVSKYDEIINCVKNMIK